MIQRRLSARRCAKKHLGIESLERRELLAADFIRHNPLEPTDVNNDGVVSSADALGIIRVMNAESPDVARLAASRFVDVNNDGQIGTQDALRVMDDLNSRAASPRPAGREAQPNPRSIPLRVNRPISAGTATESDSTPVEGFASIDGRDNNPEQPDWGSAGETLLRMAEARFADGASAPAGADRPSAREISNTLSVDEGLVSEDGLSAFVYAWGQFIDHDITLTPSGDEAFNIEVPAGDEYFDPFNSGTAEIPLNRANPVADSGVELAREYPNVITAWIDGSGIYGSDDETAAALRTMEGGKLKTSDGDLLPLNNAETFPDGPLDMDNDANIVPDEELFAAGDIRANENIELTSLHTLFVREHNRIADEIAEANPTLSDEAIYQQARSIVIAELQAITYNEWLPAIVGERALGRYEGYDATVNPNIAIEFSAAAFRFGHSQLGDDVEFLNNEGVAIAEEVPLSHAFSNPSLVSENGIDSIIKYLASDPSSEIDLQAVDSVRNFLFGPPGSGGLDLPSLNIQRGRDVGLADYNSTREAYGLGRITSFADITTDVEVQQKLQQLYGSVDNLDLWVGGLAEDHVRETSIGETFQTIIVDQFERLRDGDRNWYQNVFTASSLRSLERTTLTDIIERNTSLKDLQQDVFYFEASISGRVAAEIDLNANTQVAGVVARPLREQPVGLAGQTVQLIGEGEVIATTMTDGLGRYSFDVVDGLRTGEFEVRWMSGTDEQQSAMHEVTITTGDVHVRGIDFITSANELNGGKNRPRNEARPGRTIRPELPPAALAARDVFFANLELLGG